MRDQPLTEKLPLTLDALLLLLAMAGVLMLTGCGSLTKPYKAELPQALTKPCPPLQALTDGSAASVLDKLIEITQAYYECADRHEALAKAVK